MMLRVNKSELVSDTCLTSKLILGGYLARSSTILGESSVKLVERTLNFEQGFSSNRREVTFRNRSCNSLMLAY